MKNLILGFAVCTVAFACKSNDDKAEVANPEGANAPEVNCCGDDAGCDTDASACAEKTDCAASESCDSAKVCPMTGKTIEN